MMNAILLTVLLVATCASASLDEQTYRDRFTAWTHQHGKAYTSEEFQTRYAIFKDNLDYVERWNADPSHTHTLETNFLADLTNAEYQRIYLGTRFDATDRIAAAKELVTDDRANNVGAPASVDWRLGGAVTAIKNQGQCGSCWSFSTTGSTEGIHKLSTGNLVSLSEQNLMDCSTSEGNQGCNGGLMDNAFKYIISNKGIDTEASYPYKGVQGTCRFNSANVGATIDGYKDVTAGSESALLTAAAMQPVSVAIDASHTSFQLYSSGVYYESACSTSQLDHGVLVIGYGADSGSDFWLVKNSWGTTWGLQGYIQMSRNRNNNCGIASSASYPTISGATSGTSASASGSSGSSNTNGGNTNGGNTNGGNTDGSNTNGGNTNGNTATTYGNELGRQQPVFGGKGQLPVSKSGRKSIEKMADNFEF